MSVVLYFHIVLKHCYLFSIFETAVVEIVDSEAKRCCGGCPGQRNLSALIWKNIKRLSRNTGFLLFTFLLPAIQVVLFCVAIGMHAIYHDCFVWPLV